MKATERRLIRLVLLFMLLSGYACERIERELYSNEDGRFVRFNLQLDADGNIADPGRLNPSMLYATEYHKKSIDTLAVPVSLTSEPLTDDVHVTFSVLKEGPCPGVQMLSDSILTFSGSRLTDTILFAFSERWNSLDNNRIILTLEDVSDPDIHIGNLISDAENDQLTIYLSDLYLRYYIQQNNLLEITGESGEQIGFDIYFPDGLFRSEIDTAALLIADSEEFAYTLEKIPVNDGDKKVSYLFTVNEQIDIDNFRFRNIFRLRQIENYYIAGNSTLWITKPEKFERDKTVNTAANFYNLSDPFYRTYGENWMDYNEDDTCEWTSFNAFTYPVVVGSTDPNAVLYDDKGTEDPSDDVYHHAFRIGFNSPNAGNTTNSFNLKRWFNNESTNESVSPGFNVVQALEFFPSGGNSELEGLVRVVEQELVIAATATTGGTSHTIHIEGDGTYSMIADGIFEIILELRATNEELFGGTRYSYYRIYNTSDYTDPADLTESCFRAMDL